MITLTSDSSHGPRPKPEANADGAETPQELRRRLAELEAVYASAPVACALLDRDLRYTRLNEAMARVNGLPIEAHLGRRPGEVLPRIGERIEELARGVLGTGEPVVEAEVRGERPSRPGRDCVCRASYFPLRDEQGNVNGVHVVVLDVTDHKQAEEALQERETRLEALLASAIDAIVTIDEAGTLEAFNPAAERMFGYAAGEVLGRHVALLMPELPRHLRTGEAQNLGIGREVEGLRKDGTSFPLELAITEVQAGSRRFTAFLRDLSERKRLQAEFQQAQKMEAIGRLAAGIAHDFNNLLMGVLGCARMAAGHMPAGSPASSLLEEIRSAAESGAALTRQLLAFARRRPVHPRPMRVGDAVEDAREMLRQVLGEDIRLDVAVCPSKGPVLADPVQIEQVLMNLVVNARDAMPHGGRLALEVVEEPPRRGDGGRRQVVLRVADSGTGIPPDARAHIFEPFFTTKGPGEGTGLGLSTVYGIVHQLGGRVDFESHAGRGTTFRVHLPLHEEGLQEAGSSSEGAQAPRHAEPRPSPAAVAGAGRTVLVVEDERLVRAALRHSLAGLGFQVLVAEGGEQALELCERHPGAIDLLLTDMILPGMDGREIATAVRARRPQVRTLYMSAHPHETLVDQGRIAEEDPSLEKPFSDDQLSAALRTALAEVHSS